jgi:hypothetical protein
MANRPAGLLISKIVADCGWFVLVEQNGQAQRAMT